MADEPVLWDALYHALHRPPGAEPFAPDVVRLPSIALYVDGWMWGDDGVDDLGFLAERGGAPVGAAWVRRWTGERRGYGFVAEEIPELSMAVWPGHRGQGVGSRLLTLTLEAAAKVHPAVSLSVSVSNPALRLYERFGFEISGEPEGGSVTMCKTF